MLCRRTLLRLHSVAPARCWSSTEPNYNRRFQDKVAVITGSTDGIGYATAERLAREGAKVVVSSRKQENVDKAVKRLTDEGLTVTGSKCSVANEEERQKLLEHTIKEFGGLDILVCNAGISPGYGPILEANKTLFDKVFDVNVTASFLLSQAAIPEMKKKGGGSIVMVGTAGSFWRTPTLGPYCISKTALLGLVKGLSVDCADINVRVNAVVPGVIETSFSSLLPNDKKFMAIYYKDALIKRFGKVEEVANAIAFLASHEASFITGENLTVSGGLPTRL